MFGVSLGWELWVLGVTKRKRRREGALCSQMFLNHCRGFWAHCGDSEHLSKARRQHFTCLYSKEKEPAAPINSPKLKYSCRAQCLRIKGEVLLLKAVVLSYPPASSCSRLHPPFGINQWLFKLESVWASCSLLHHSTLLIAPKREV